METSEAWRPRSYALELPSRRRLSAIGRGGMHSEVGLDV